MLVQVNAYVVLDRVVMTASVYKQTDEGSPWGMLISETLPLGEMDAEDPHDVLWAAARAITEHETWRARPGAS